jgi:carboxyl-terminal processing protease
VKNRIWLAFATLVFVAISLPVFVSAQNQGSSATPSKTPSGPVAPSTSTRRPRPSPRLPSDATAGTEQDFSDALTIIQENYIDGNKLDYNAVFKSSIIGMLRSLDPHSNYYDREEFDEMKTDQRSEYFGIGASIGNQRKGDQTETYILATFEGSPAARAGLVFGDRIVEVNGEKMSGRTSLEVRDRIRGPRGSVVKLMIERGSTNRIEPVEITRDAVAQPSIPDAYFLRPGVAYIDMTHGFNYTTADELEEKLEDLRAKGMSQLVLDLRNNPGGFLEQAVRVASKFLQRGQLILTQKGRQDQRPYRANNDGQTETTPLVILVNGNTASASEIVAGAMQDHDRALIVGETSFGKGLVQGIWPLEYGAGLTLTSAKYYTPSGRLIQRDYSNGGFYDYYTRGGSTRADQKDEQQKPTGPESHTDTGRAVYGGGGISPDEVVKPRTVSNVQARLLNPMFFFTRELVNGRIPGFDQYKIARVIDYNRDLQPTDFPVTDALYKAFRDYMGSDPNWKPLAMVLDRNRSFVELQLRYNIITAAYGSVRAARVFVVTDDPQVARGVDALPRARELAMNALRAARKEP